MIKVLLWDIDGTILNFLAAERVAIRTCFELMKLGECTDEMIEQYSKINVKYWEALERGEMTKPQILVGRFSEFFRENGIDEAYAPEFNDLYQIRLGDTIVFYPHALETITELKGKVLQCAVTNGTKVAQTRKLKESGLDKLLDYIFISEELGIEKPNKGFFDKVFADIFPLTGELAPDEIMIVGDSLTSDIKGGNNAGIVTCRFNPEGKAGKDGIRVDYDIRDIAEVKELLG